MKNRMSQRTHRNMRIMGKPILMAGAALVLAGCSYVPDWANPVDWYDNIFTDDGEAFIDAPREAGEGGFPVVADVPRQPPPVATPAERGALAEGLAGDRDNARYNEQQLRQGGAAGAPLAVAAAPAPAPVPGVTPAPGPRPPAVPVGVVEAAPLGNPALPDLAIPELAVPLPPGAAAGGMAVIADAAPLPDLGFGLTPLMPVAPIGDVAALAQPIPPPALMPVLPPAPPLPVAQMPAAPMLVPVLPPAPAAPQFAAAAPAAPVPMPAPMLAQMPVPTPQQVAQILPPAAAGGQNTLALVFAEMLQQSQATVTIVPPLAGMPAASPPNVVVPGFDVGAGFAELEAAGVVPLQSLGGLPIFAIAPTVVTFRHDSTALSAEARNQIHQVVDAYKENGGKIRVVGHASQRTRDMAFDDHLRINFRISANRAGAVASELMRLGVDPSALTIDAVGDAQPQFLEAMPAGEAGNRRVEIFVEA